MKEYQRFWKGLGIGLFFSFIIWMSIFLFFSSFTSASSEWQTSTYATQEGLQIVYPKFDAYRFTDTNVIFNFNVYDESNNPIDDANTTCVMYFYASNGSRILEVPLSFDGTNFYYNLDLTNFSQPQNIYYTVFCDGLEGKGFMSNNFQFTESGIFTNPNGYLSISIIILGIICILAYLGRNTPDKNISGFFSMISIALFVGLTNLARLFAIDQMYPNSIISSIWIIEWVTIIMLLFIIIWMIYQFVYSVLVKFGKIKGDKDV
jgi:hypothetical protein